MWKPVAMPWGCAVMALMFLVSGTLHFAKPEPFLQIMPPYLPGHRALLYLSGVAELLGAVGLCMPATRRMAAWGLVALLVGVLPANVYMATAHVAAPGIFGESWAQWVRVPLQGPLIWWAWLYTRKIGTTVGRG